MYKNGKLLAIIPARGGSKGLPGKNIKPMCGKPLLNWTVEQALASRHIDRVFVSTDSEEIADVARSRGEGLAPFLRPPELAEDHSPTADAVIHTIEQFSEMGEDYDYVIILEPTSPLRREHDIDTAIELIVDSPQADTLVSVGEVHTEHPMIVKRIGERGYLEPYVKNIDKIHQRQQADAAYFPYGVIYISSTPYFLENKTFYAESTLPYVIERWQNYEVDDAVDFHIIECLADKYMR